MDESTVNGYARDILANCQIWGMKREEARAIAKKMIALTRDKNYEWRRMRNHQETLDLMKQAAKSPEDHARIAELSKLPIPE